MTTATVNLKRFCDSSESARYDCREPFSVGGWLYATDTRIAVRLAGDGLPPGSRKVPKVESLSWWGRFPLQGAEPLGALTLPELKPQPCGECDMGKVYECPECDGHGEVEWDGDYSNHVYSATCRLCDGDGTITGTAAKEHGWTTATCPECGGTGLDDAEEGEPVVICGVRVAIRYARRIAELGEVRVSGVGGEVLLFEAGGVQGLVMGTRA